MHDYLKIVISQSSRGMPWDGDGKKCPNEKSNTKNGLIDNTAVYASSLYTPLKVAWLAVKSDASRQLPHYNALRSFDLEFKCLNFDVTAYKNNK